MSTLLEKNESAALKAVLIFLIILGHNMFFTSLPLAKNYDLMRWLYSFHIQGFFMLPFLYGKTTFSKKRIGDYAIRFFVPFVLWVIVLISINQIFFKIQDFSWIELLRGCVTGSTSILQKYTNVQFLWFLPVFFYLMLLKDFYFSISAKWRYVLYCLSGTFSVLLYSNPLTVEYSLSYSDVTPLIIVFHYFFMGITFLYILHLNIKTSFYVILFIGLSAAYISVFCLYEKINNYKWYEHSIYNNLIKMFLPYVFMGGIMGVKRWLGSFRILQEIGNRSFSIYLVSPFVGYILYYGNMRFLKISNSIILVMVSQFLICCISYYICKMVTSNYFLSRFLFPKGTISYKEIFSKNKSEI